jgi:glycosyltransferase involved in cell wall biosynthesis
MEALKKTKVVFASVLKPIDDTRMFEKMAQSIASLSIYEIHVIGYPSSLKPTAQNIFFHPLQTFKRISLKRLWAPVIILRKLWRIKPDLIIINTHELLGAAITVKILTGCKVCYDIQENYFRNIFHTQTFPVLLRPFLALYVRTKEISFSPLINHFILAERGYEKEIWFTGKRRTILENKVKKIESTFAKKSNEDKCIHLLFSGTLAETTGVFEAIRLAEALHKKENRVRLTIIGYCALENVLQKIKAIIQHQHYIEVIGGDKLIPHHEILKEIQQSDFGIISYPPNPSTENAFPTKLFEYMGERLPILLTDFKLWTDYCARYKAAITVKFDDIDEDGIIREMKTNAFYTSYPTDIYWEDEKFRALIKQLI